MICTIMQPTYMSWLGIFNLMSSVDKYVFLDDVQLNRSSWQTRNRIKMNGRIHLISIPVKKDKSQKEQWLNDSIIDFSTKWQKKHTKTIFHAYKAADYFEESYPLIENLINQNELSLSEFNINISKKIANEIA